MPAAARPARPPPMVTPRAARSRSRTGRGSGPPPPAPAPPRPPRSGGRPRSGPPTGGEAPPPRPPPAAARASHARPEVARVLHLVEDEDEGRRQPRAAHPGGLLYRFEDRRPVRRRAPAHPRHHPLVAALPERDGRGSPGRSAAPRARPPRSAPRFGSSWLRAPRPTPRGAPKGRRPAPPRPGGPRRRAPPGAATRSEPPAPTLAPAPSPGPGAGAGPVPGSGPRFDLARASPRARNRPSLSGRHPVRPHRLEMHPALVRIGARHPHRHRVSHRETPPGGLSHETPAVPVEAVPVAAERPNVGEAVHLEAVEPDEHPERHDPGEIRPAKTSPTRLRRCWQTSRDTASRDASSARRSAAEVLRPRAAISSRVPPASPLSARCTSRSG